MARVETLAALSVQAAQQGRPGYRNPDVLATTNDTREMPQVHFASEESASTSYRTGRRGHRDVMQSMKIKGGIISCLKMCTVLYIL